MQKKKYNTGFFIVFEGGEGCGKSTQLRALVRFLKSQGVRPILTREPGGTPLGKGIRRLLLHAKHAVSPIAELCLYAADRAHNVETVIKPALAEARVVISDRHTDSTLVYQGIARGLPVAASLNKVAVGELRPDLVIILDVPAEIGLERVRGRGGLDRLEKEAIGFHRKVRKGFLSLKQTNSRRYQVFDGTLPLREISQQIQTLVVKRLKNKDLWPNH